MTLHYWWMHWFWITCLCNVGILMICAATLESSEVTKIPSNNDSLHRAAKAVGVTSYIPPITISAGNASTPIIYPNKFYKSSKKQELYLTNVTNNFTTSTVPSVVKESSVIDQNVTDVGFNSTDNQTFNTSLNAINNTENFTYTSEDNLNQSLIVNSERVGSEEHESTSGNLTAAGITGITLGCVSIVGVICAVSFIMYRNIGLNRPQVLNDRCSNPDSSGYIDDSTENSEEMYSLDNDSFLNSLEAMTIQNLWTDSVKHTKL